MSSLPRRAALSSAIIAGATVLAAGSASAQGNDPRHAIDRTEVSERGSSWFVNDSLDLRGRLRPSLGVVASYGHRLLTLAGSAEPVVRDLAVVHLGGSLVMLDRVRLSLDIPLAPFADGRSGVADTRLFPAPASEQGFGDLRASLDARVLGRHQGPLTSAIGVALWAPTGQRSLWLSDGALRAAPRVMFAGMIARRVEWAAQAFTLIRAHEDDLGASAVVGTELGGAAAVGLSVPEASLLVGSELRASTALRDALGVRSSPAEAMLMVRHDILLRPARSPGSRDGSDDRVRIGAAIGTRLTSGIGAGSVRVMLGVEWVLGALSSNDRDGDGVPDDEDACPRAPGARTRDPRTNGCPSDRDGDGIADVDDACPDVPGPRARERTDNGCPDRDGDGIADIHDACPFAPGPPSTDPKTNGCPLDADSDDIPDERDACPYRAGIATNDPSTNGCPPDTDGDGIDDLEDACPTVAGPRTDDESTTGCDLDRDKDGVANDVDACVLTPGPPDPDPRRNGCPRAYVEGDRVRLLDQPRFAGSELVTTDKDTRLTLDALATLLKEHAELTTVRVEGHTDDHLTEADKTRDRRLSLERASALVRWLTAHGVAASRLSAVGRGGEHPLESNETSRGRTRNRRIEIHLRPEEGR